MRRRDSVPGVRKVVIKGIAMEAGVPPRPWRRIIAWVVD
jgi:hypothetical protein